MTNDQRPMSDQTPMTRERRRQRLLPEDAGRSWIIERSLVIGHWPSGILEGRDLLPNAVQPPFALVVADRAFGDEADAGVGHVITEDGVVRGHILAAHNAAENGFLFFARDERFAT